MEKREEEEEDVKREVPQLVGEEDLNYSMWVAIEEEYCVVVGVELWVVVVNQLEGGHHILDLLK